jgi:hypothetical protein
MAWLPIKYREFYDVPRAIVVERDGEFYLFDSPFDGDADEYPAYFAVYRLSAYVASQLDSGSWEGLAAQSELLGRVAVEAVEFDPSRRSLMNDEVFNLLPRESRTPDGGITDA